MSTCVFCQLLSREEALLEVSAHAASFLDNHPLRPGHVLVVPKIHEPEFFALPDHVHADIMRLAKRTARAQQRTFEPLKVGMLVAGMDVPHAHLHLVPMHDYHDVTSKRMLEGKVSRASDADLRESQRRLKNALSLQKE